VIAEAGASVFTVPIIAIAVGLASVHLPPRGAREAGGDGRKAIAWWRRSSGGKAPLFVGVLMAVLPGRADQPGDLHWVRASADG
jgi:hypothetical protein